MSNDRYAAGVTTSGREQVPQVPAEHGLVVEDVTSGWVGAVVRVEKSGGQHLVELEDRRGRTRSFTLGAGFWIDGRPVVLVPPRPSAAKAQSGTPGRTASGSRAVPDAPARVARASRIWVEGRHDAELVEKVWGDDLRVEGVVVELLDGADNLPEAVRAFAPGPGRRLGVLVDHLVPGSKESRLADEAVRAAPPGTVLVLGHPWVDVWQTVRPQRLGMDAWPVVPRGTDWKTGVLAAMGWPHGTYADIANAWARILGTVRTYADLDPALLGRVEELIDFVTA
ncbi:MAG: DUF3097 domain-containing protein [Micrococcales bacterium]|nr:DUF3097 domain-containing protein [Micrococcales bacterium]MCL2666752.1 DUF3097 domain-containing protein [Micrococcales bacterium]